MRLYPICLLVLLLSSCGGPFRPPNFEKSVQLASEGSLCVTRLQGTWPNLPHNPIQWFVGGRTNLLVTVRSPSKQERYTTDQITVYYTWPNSAPYQLKELSGYVEHQGELFIVDLSQNLDKTTNRQLEMNGKYVVKNPNGCT
jgi:hypothetical protein